MPIILRSLNVCLLLSLVATAKKQNDSVLLFVSVDVVYELRG